MSRKKYSSLALCALLVSTMSLTACSSLGGNSIELSDVTFTGTVESVDGNTVTLTLGSTGGEAGGTEMGGGQMPEGDTAAEGDQAQAGGTPPEMPSGDAGGQGGMGGGMMGMGGASSVTGTVKLVIKDTSVITTTGEATTDDATADDADASQSDDADTSEATGMDAITEGSSLTVTLDEDGKITDVAVGGAGMGGGMGGMSTGVESYDAVQEYTTDEDVSDKTIESTGTDENAVHVYEGANVTLKDVDLSRKSDDSTGGDNASFYGVGAALLTTDGNTYVSGGEVTTDAAGGAGLFAYDTGTIYAADTKIKTTQDTSGGIHAAGGGTFYAWDLDVETDGESSAAIRSDRGGGTMVVDGGKYTANGTGSPAIYCTADIAVNDATLTATGSEAVCIEGLNTLHLYDCDLSGAMKDDEQNDCTWNLIVYQSMSGDSEVGNSTMNIVGGTITAENGGLIYTTNTESTMLLSDVDITYAEDSEFFLRCTGNHNQRGWGQTGANGAQCNFTADSQEMKGDIIYDSISNLDFYMQNTSNLTGAFVDDESCAGEGGDGTCNLSISKDSTWTVTGDSTLSTLHNEGTIQDEQGNTVTIKGTDGTVHVEGNSQYTVTVGSYDTTADFTNASKAGTFADYAQDKPENL